MNLTWYPLCWPDGQKGTLASNRVAWPGNPEPTVATAFPKLQEEIFRHNAVTEYLVSSDVPLSKDRKPLSTKEYQVAHPGVAVWLKRNGKWICVACDRFARPSANMRAITLILEGRRREERYGTTAMVEASWDAFQAPQLPQRTGQTEGGPPWWEVLSVSKDAPIEVAEAAYRVQAAKAHPDVKGGDSDRMARLNAAISAARKEKNG